MSPTVNYTLPFPGYLVKIFFVYLKGLAYPVAFVLIFTSKPILGTGLSHPRCTENKKTARGDRLQDRLFGRSMLDCSLFDIQSLAMHSWVLNEYFEIGVG